MAHGMNQTTGLSITGVAELQQRIARLFRTRKGSLVTRRNYGSNLPRLVDGKVTDSFQVDLYAETAAALAEPANEISDEFRLRQVRMHYEDGNVSLDLDGELVASGEPITMEGIRL